MTFRFRTATDNSSIHVTRREPFGIFTQLGITYTRYTTEYITGLILGLHPANERCRNKVTASLICWAQTYNQPWFISICHELCSWFALYVLFWLAWWRHQMGTFSALLAICAGNSPVPGEFLAQRPATRSYDVFSDLRLNKRLRKQSWGWWFETLSRPLWRHCNINDNFCPHPNGTMDI